MSLHSRASILQSQALPTEEVATPEWGADTSVRVRALTAAERDQWEVGNYDLRGKETKVTLANARARLFALGAVDEQGQRLFSDGDAAQLGRLHSAPLDRAYEVIRRLSGMTADEAEGIRKNSAAAPAEDSATA